MRAKIILLGMAPYSYIYSINVAITDNNIDTICTHRYYMNYTNTNRNWYSLQYTTRSVA